MQTTRTRRGSSFQERDSEGRFTDRSRGNGYRYENDYDDDRYGNRSSRYDEDDFDEGVGYGRSSRFQGRFQGDEDYYNQDYSRGRRAYDDSAEYDDEDYDVNRYDEDEDEDYGTRGRYDREDRWGRRDYSSLNRGEYRNQPRGQHTSGWDERYYGNVSRRRGYTGGGGFDGGRYEGGYYRQGRGYGSDMEERGLRSRRSSEHERGFASMPRDEVRRIASMGGRAASRSRRSTRTGGSQRSSRSRSRG
jgi:hypothetical protein